MDISFVGKRIAKLPLAAIALVFSVASVVQSVRQGQLSAPITYDDISYFVDAGHRLQSFYDVGFKGLFHGYLAYPPHSPTATFVAFVAFLLFGFQDWAPALVNSVWVVLLLLAIRRELRDLPGWAVLSVAIAILAWPVTGFLVIESRPDIVNGFLLASGCVGIVGKPWVLSGRSHRLKIALIFALALLTKPSVFPITLALYGFSLALATAVDYVESKRTLPLSAMALAALEPACITIAIVLPHYVLAIGREINYIIVTTFTTQYDIWAAHNSAYDHATYYLWGEGGRRTMGVWLYITAGLVIAAFILAAIDNRRWVFLRPVAMGAVFAASFAMVTIPGQQSLFLGVQVTCFNLVFFVLACRSIFTSSLASRPGPALPALFCVGLIGAAALSFQWHWFNRTGASALETAETLAARRALIDSVLSTINTPAAGAARVYFPAITKYLDSTTLNYEMLKRRSSGGMAYDSHRSEDVAEHLRNIASATHVVLFSEDDPDVFRWLPSYRSLPAVSAAVRSDPAFTRIAAFTPPISGGPIEIFARDPTFKDVNFVSGFLPLEGPYPQWSLPQVRWGLETVATISLSDRHPEPGRLRIVARSPLPGQEIGVFAGDREIGRCRLPEANQKVDCMVDLPSLPGGADLQLRFLHSGRPDDGFRSVLFLDLSDVSR